MLNGIELVQSRSGQLVTSSSKVAEVFEKRHDNILRDLENFKGLLLNFEEMYFESEELDRRNRKRKVVYMNQDGFTLLAMGFTGAKALQFKVEYVKEFRRMEEYIKNQIQQHSYMIDDPIKRAEKWIEEQKEKQELALTLEQQKPKVLLADSIENSNSLILIRELATILNQNGINIGQNRLFERLRDMGYLIKSGASKNSPTQRSMDLGLFRLVEGTRTSSSGSTITKTTKVTGKGQTYFVNKFLKEAKNV